MRRTSRRHATDLVEHPELVADRIITFGEIVSRGDTGVRHDIYLIFHSHLGLPTRGPPRAPARRVDLFQTI